MFVKVFDTARRVLSRSPSIQVRPIEASETPPIDGADANLAMVTTRRGNSTHGTVATPKPAAKRELDLEETPKRAKRQRNSGPNSNADVVKDLQAKEQVHDESASEEDIEPEVECAVEGTDVRKDGAVLEFAIRLGHSGHVEEVPSSRFESDQAPDATQDEADVSLPSVEDENAVEEGKDKISVNDVEEAEVEDEDEKEEVDEALSGHVNNTQAGKIFERAEEFNEEETVLDASDSDEAPETLSTATALSRVKLQIQETERAQQAQVDKLEARQKARETRIADEKAAKRKREEKRAKHVAKQAAEQGDITTDEPPQPSARGPKSIPNFLPDSLLSSISSTRPLTPPPTNQIDRARLAVSQRAEKFDRHIKFLETSTKAPKDVRKGNLSVAVLNKQSKVLAPKVNKDKSNMREHWLKERRVEQRKGGKKNYKWGKMERRDFRRGGFLKGGEV